MKVNLIEGTVFSDERGAMSFVNDFKFYFINLFYILKNLEAHPVCAWQGRKLDYKNFHCIKWSFKVSYVKIDDWGHLSSSLKLENAILEARNSNVLKNSTGYSNAFITLETGSRLMSFSRLSSNQLKEDGIRFGKNKWNFYE